MRTRLFQATLVLALILSLYKTASSKIVTATIDTPNSTIYISDSLIESNISVESSKVEKVKSSIEEVKEVEEINNIPIKYLEGYYDVETDTYLEEEFWDDMELVALVCVAESEGESELGKRLVIDTIFNRLESPYFPDTIYEVVYDNSQYTCVWNGRLDKVEYDEEIANLVMEEMINRTNSDVIYFKTDGFFNDNNCIQEGNHFFCGNYDFVN